jgi:hypothetical protein
MSESVTLPEACHRVGAPYLKIWHVVASGRVRAERAGPAGRYRVAVEDLPLLAAAVGATPPEPAPRPKRPRPRAA